jgi:hypothetical protein
VLKHIEMVWVGVSGVQHDSCTICISRRDLCTILARDLMHISSRLCAILARDLCIRYCESSRDVIRYCESSRDIMCDSRLDFVTGI